MKHAVLGSVINEGKFESALIIDQKLARTLVGETLGSNVQRSLLPILEAATASLPDGTLVNIEVMITLPGDQK